MGRIGSLLSGLVQVHYGICGEQLRRGFHEGHQDVVGLILGKYCGSFPGLLTHIGGGWHILGFNQFRSLCMGSCGGGSEVRWHSHYGVWLMSGAYQQWWSCHALLGGIWTQSL